MNEFQKLITEKKVKELCYALFEVELTSMQEKIVKAIAYKEHPRLIVSCMTRYGKTLCISLGVLLYILFYDDKKINLVSPTFQQTSIIRNYMSEYLLKCSLLYEQLEFKGGGVKRLKREVSRKRLTFKNGCELRVLSAEGEAKRLMGHGGELLIIDESCMIDGEVFKEKISRMLGDTPEAMLVEIGNPWDKNNQFYEHWVSPSFKKFHVDYKTALEEGRVSQEFIDEQREQLTSLQFRILYEAEFPDTAEDQLFGEKELSNLCKQLTARELELLKQKPDEVRLGVDVARFGNDLTVLIKAQRHGNQWFFSKCKWFEKKDTMKTVGEVIAWDRRDNFDKINVDDPGVGGGVVDRLKEVEQTGAKVFGFLGGGTPPKEKEKFLNNAAYYYRLFAKEAGKGNVRIAFDEKLSVLQEQLRKLSFEFTSAGKMKIVKPEEKSPDFADAANIALSQGSGVVFDFL